MTARRPPPPWELPRLKATSTIERAARRTPPLGEQERVSAAQLRPNDWLVTDGEGPLRILAVERSATEVRLLSNGAWWSCKPSTRFVRVRQSRRIEMRPDLHRGSS